MNNTYYYHPDHLGSTSMVTNIDGEITQNVVYIPYGEVFVEERNGAWSSPYLFNAKELDEETGLYYYGARYLDPTSTRWLSVDPMWEKYMGMSPYNYCAGNPVVMVDLDGREATIQGEAAELYKSSLEEKCSGICLHLENDKLMYDKKNGRNGEKQKLNNTDKLIMRIIDDPDIKVDMYTLPASRNKASFNGESYVVVFGGSFMGNVYNEENGVGKVTALQFVNPHILDRMDRYANETRGTSALHELSEAYEGALISKENQRSSPMANLEGSVYEKAHKQATKQPEVRSLYIDKDNRIFYYPTSDCIYEQFEVLMKTMDGSQWKTVTKVPFTYKKDK
ncbi:MAG: hypothetical protein J6Y37_00610 [Paludibacteraceae bacterium]|nr:hypothetical protein [Paludibacteraceae bacterium]